MELFKKKKLNFMVSLANCCCFNDKVRTSLCKYEHVSLDCCARINMNN